MVLLAGVSSSVLISCSDCWFWTLTVLRYSSAHCDTRRVCDRFRTGAIDVGSVTSDIRLMGARFGGSATILVRGGGVDIDYSLP